MSEIQFTPGDVLLGKYRIERALGAGGMGLVLSAWHIELEQRVAIKLMLPGRAPEEQRQRFLREARLSARLASPHVVKVLDVGMHAMGAAEQRTLTNEEESVLSSGGFDTSPLHAGETYPIVKTEAEYRTLLRNSLSVSQTARCLGVNSSRVRQRLVSSPPTLYGIKEGKSWRVPKFQFTGRRPIPGLAAVVSAMPPDLPVVTVYRWLTEPQPDLFLDAEETQRVSPLRWLRMGRAPNVVADLARDL